MLVDGRAQVSMNLTNFRSTPLARVVEMIRREAERYGTTIHHSELVGLIPQEALTEAARYYIQLDQFEPDQILEMRLAAALEKEAGKSGAAEAASDKSARLKPHRKSPQLIYPIRLDPPTIFWMNWPPVRPPRAAVQPRHTAARPARRW